MSIQDVKTTTKEERTKFLAEADASKAEAELFKAEARKMQAEAERAESDTRVAKISEARENYRREIELALDEHHKVYRFFGTVDFSTVNDCITQLGIWSRMHPGCDIELVITSGGGDVIAGLALFDHIQGMRKSGHKVTTKAQGISASMAGVLLQAGDERVMTKEAWMLIHEASFGVSGKYGEVQDTVSWVEKIQERLLDVLSERSTLSKSQIKKKWSRKDWWLDSDEALKLKFVDRVE